MKFLKLSRVVQRNRSYSWINFSANTVQVVEFTAYRLAEVLVLCYICVTEINLAKQPCL